MKIRKHYNTNKINGPEISLEYFDMELLFHFDQINQSLLHSKEFPLMVICLWQKVSLYNHKLRSMSKVYLRD